MSLAYIYIAIFLYIYIYIHIQALFARMHSAISEFRWCDSAISDSRSHAPFQHSGSRSYIMGNFIYIYFRRHFSLFFCRNLCRYLPTMDHFEQVRARVGAARVVLSQVENQPSRRATMSTLQTDALVDMLSQQACRDSLNPFHKATIGEQVLAAGFPTEDEAKILEALSSSSITTFKVRRKPQDGMAFLNYISAAEWQKIPGMQKMELANLLISICIDRLGLVNMSEPTKKLMASVILVFTTEKEMIDLVTIEDKVAMKTWIVKNVKKRTEQMNGFPPCEYCIKLPYDPKELLPNHPKLYNRAKIDGCFVEAKIDQNVLAKLDNSYQCRNTLAAGRCHLGNQTLCAMPSSANPMQAMIAMMMQMQQVASVQRGRQRDDIDGVNIDLQFPPSRKRCSSMLSGALQAAASDHQSTSDLDHLTLHGVNSRKQHLRRAVTVDFDSGNPCNQPGELPGEPEQQARQPEQPAGMPALRILDGQSAQQNAPAAKPSIDRVPELLIDEKTDDTADPLLAAMVARDAERTAENKRLAGEKRSAAAAEKREAKDKEKAAAQAAAAMGQQVPAVAVVVKSSGKVGRPRKVVQAKPSKVVKPPASKVVKPPTKKVVAKAGVSHETTRSSYLCRTGGVGPTGSKAFSYKGEVDEATAKKNATEWLEQYLATHA